VETDLASSSYIL